MVLRMLARDLVAGLGDVQMAIPGHDAEERVIVWHGLPPPPVPRHANVAPVVLEGEIDGRRTYAEAVPRGVRPSLHAPPPELLGFIVADVLVGLRFLHEAGEVHGAVGPDRIVLGTRGEVVLVGRGRQGGHARIDVVSALSLLPREAETTLLEADANRLVAQVRSQSPSTARGLLAAWVRSVMEDAWVVDEVLLGMGEETDAVDEIVPDIGPDAASGGLLDRRTGESTPGITTTTGEVTAAEVTAGEITSDATGEAVPERADLALSLWATLSSPPERPPPATRFEHLRGIPSAGLRAVLDSEGIDLLPGPLVGTIGPFVVDAPKFDDQPTIVAPTPLEGLTGRRAGPASRRRIPWTLLIGLGVSLLLALVLWRLLL